MFFKFAGFFQLACCVLAIVTPPAKAQPVDGHGLVHRFFEVELAPNGQSVGSVEGDSSASGGNPTLRDLVIRQVRSGAKVTIVLPCGHVAQYWAGSLAWSSDSKRLAFAMRTPGGHHE